MSESTSPSPSTVDTNATTTHLTVDLMVAYSAIVTMAVIPIYIGSFLSLHRKNTTKASDRQEEAMTKKDAYMFPVIGSAVLFGLYVLFQLFSKDYVNLLLTVYFLFLGFYALAETFVHVIVKVSPALNNSKSRSFSYRLPWKSEQETIQFNNADIVSWIFAVICLIWYSITKNWISNNLIGLAFCVQGVSLISLGSYQVGCILLGGLFFYDIFWVFGTDVMVTVAKSFDAPIKLLFPKSLFAEKYSFSMLGLGDIVIPGIFIALLLRYDIYRSKRNNKKNRFESPTPYFTTTIVSYTFGLILTIFVMHTFQAAQPALLYLVPACLGASATRALMLGDFWNLFAFEEKEDEEKKGGASLNKSQTEDKPGSKKPPPKKKKL
jgi:minor histocompatibility antigen H13